MKIDLSCPVELWHYALPTTEYPACRMQLFNLTEQTVSSIQAVFSCFDSQGALMSRQVERIPDLDGQGRSAFEMTVEIEDGVHAAGLDFSIEKVWFSDGTVWRHVAGHGSEYMPNALPAGRRLAVLRQLSGPDAVGFPSDQGAVWVCVCGRPNSPSSDVCRRCERQKREVFTRCNEAAVEAIIINHEAALEEKARRERAEAERLAAEQAALLQKKRKRRRAITLACLGTASALLAAYGIYFHGIPFYRYYTASRQLENGVYTTARTTFDDLSRMRGVYSLPVRIDALKLNVDLLDSPFYYKSAELSKECDYRQAASAMNIGTITSLKTAQDAFDALGDYRDSAECARLSRYLRAERLAATAQYENAVQLYDEIPGYEDADIRRMSAVYRWAGQMMEDLEFFAAREKYLSLGDYEDAAALASACVYTPAVDAIETGDYLNAIDLLSLLDPAYQNTALRLQEAHYGAANNYFNAGNYETAADHYLLAGDYKDAYSQATACLYEPAFTLFSQGQYAVAKESFDKILSFRDSQLLSWQCSYYMALEQKELGRYDEARALLNDALGYEDAALLMKECIYLPAVALQQQGDLSAAAAMFAQIPDYADADDRLELISYDLALQLLATQDYQAAVSAFAALGDYEDSEAQLQAAQYGYALELLTAGDYQQAADRFNELDGYEESAYHRSAALYALGMEALDTGKLSLAAEYFYNAGTHADAPQQYAQALYALAAESFDKSDYDAAAGYLSLIPDYQDADELRQQSVYLSAGIRREAGDLSGAAALYASIPDYHDAAAQADACYDAYYQESYESAKLALSEKRYGDAVTALSQVSRDNPSEEYADIDEMYNEANYEYANALYADRKPYEALKYYQNIPDYKDVTTSKLDRVCYRILGTWVSSTGIVMEFRDDGTCTLDGKDYYFYARNFSLETGDSADELKGGWTIHSCNDKTMSLENTRTNKQYRLTRQTEDE